MIKIIFQGCLPLRALHVTLASLHLSTSEDVEAAAQVIENLGQATGLEQLQASSGITFDGENFDLLLFYIFFFPHYFVEVKIVSFTVHSPLIYLIFFSFSLLFCSLLLLLCSFFVSLFQVCQHFVNVSSMQYQMSAPHNS